MAALVSWVAVLVEVAVGMAVGVGESSRVVPYMEGRCWVYRMIFVLTSGPVCMDVTEDGEWMSTAIG